MNFIEELKREIRGSVEYNKNLSDCTSFKIGGNAEIWYVPLDLEDLKNIVKIIAKNGMSLFIIGAGSGILVKDEGIKGVVLKLNPVEFGAIRREENSLVTVGAGVTVDNMLRFCVMEGLCGIEFLAGIPATFGGLICMNAGGDGWLNRKSQIGDFVQEVIGMDFQGKMKIFGKDELRFEYRSSNFSNYIVIKIRLKLNEGSPDQIKDDIKGYLDYKRKTQDLSLPSCGCIFRNPSPNIKAAKLIEECGLKGVKIGDAMVSLKHANFIVNTRKANAYDTIELVKLIQDKVRHKFKILLEPEIRIVG